MIDRFNFYDVYAYLIPGFVLLIVLWLPFGLTGTGWPDADLASALVGLVTAYVLGHVLHVLSHASIPVKIEGRFPSDLILEGKGRHFSPVLAEAVKKAIGARYGLDLFDRSGPADHSNGEGGQPSGAESAKTESANTEQHRWDALQLCRDALVREGLGKYAEQFQGMYALLRGPGPRGVLGPYVLVGRP